LVIPEKPSCPRSLSPYVVGRGAGIILHRCGGKGIVLREGRAKSSYPEIAVMPAEAGIQKGLEDLDSRFRGNDDGRRA
jgi:hypothetical protein